MKLFQYGQVLFPAGPGDRDAVWLTPFATRGHLRSLRVLIAAGGVSPGNATSGPEGRPR